MDSSVLKEKLLKGSLAGVLRVGLAIPLYLFLTPYALSRLGTAVFGIWSFSTIIISLVNLTDFGFKNGLVRYVAMNHDREEEVGRYFSATFWMYCLLSAFFVTFVLVFFDDIVLRLLHVPPVYFKEASFVILISTVSFALRFLATPFQAVIEGFQEHYYSQFVSLVWLVVNSAGSILALALYPNVYSLGVVSIVANVLVVILLVVRVRKRFPCARVFMGGVDRKVVFNLLSFGMGIQIATLVITLREPIFKILISRTGDMEALASFEVAYRLCIQLVSLIISPLLGTFAVSALLCSQRGELEKILRPIVGFTCTAFIPAVLFLVSFSPKLIAFWLGHEADDTAIEVTIIFTAFAIYYLTEPFYKAIEASGASRYSAFVQVFSMVITVAVFMSFAHLDRLVIPVSMLAGFIAFSISNYFVFIKRFKGMMLISQSKLLLLLAPALGYALIRLIISPDWLPLFFLFYLIVHLTIAVRTSIFDFIRFAGKVLELRHKKSLS
jgi:O-antigen/teichoic acid export membrane protein